MRVTQHMVIEHFMAAWSHIVRLEVIPVISSAAAAARFGRPP